MTSAGDTEPSESCVPTLAISSMTPASAEVPTCTRTRGNTDGESEVGTRSMRCTMTTGSGRTTFLGTTMWTTSAIKASCSSPNASRAGASFAQPGWHLGLGQDGADRQLVIGNHRCPVHLNDGTVVGHDQSGAPSKWLGQGPSHVGTWGCYRVVRLQPEQRGRGRTGRSRCNARPPPLPAATKRRRSAPRPGSPAGQPGRAGQGGGRIVGEGGQGHTSFEGSLRHRRPRKWCPLACYRAWHGPLAGRIEVVG